MMHGNTALGWGLMSNTALGFAPCCICYSIPPLILYFHTSLVMVF